MNKHISYAHSKIGKIVRFLLLCSHYWMTFFTELINMNYGIDFSMKETHNAAKICTKVEKHAYDALKFCRAFVIRLYHTGMGLIHQHVLRSGIGHMSRIVHNEFPLISQWMTVNEIWIRVNEETRTGVHHASDPISSNGFESSRMALQAGVCVGVCK